MKRFMMKEIRLKFSVRSVIVFVLISILALTAVAATPTSIQATLSPDISVKYNGVVQTMTDANGSEVYPLVYNGTTYVPIRAVSNILAVPVDWEGSTRTVLLGDKEINGTSLLTAGKIHKDTHSYWNAMSGAQNLPQPKDDFGNNMDAYSDGYRQTPTNTATNSSPLCIQLNQRQVQLSFTWSATGSDPSCVYTAEVFNIDTKVVLSSVEVKQGQFIEVNNLNIAGVDMLGFRVFSRASAQGTATGWILNPIVK